MTSFKQPDIPPSRFADKTALRRRYQAQREQAADTAGPAAANQAMHHLLAGIDLAADALVAAYWPMRNELDPRPLLGELSKRGHLCALPVIVARETPLSFRAWQAGEALVGGPFGTREPVAAAAAVEPDVIIVPLVAFDEMGHRLGYGGGYYDRTLGRMRENSGVLAIGYAYAGQQVATLPSGPHDQRLDWVVTEKGARAFV